MFPMSGDPDSDGWKELEWLSIGDKDKKMEVCEYMHWMSPQRSISGVLVVAKGSFFIEYESVY